ncbi:MAG: DnaD domain protein [Peptoclostridium sp.]|uniref:DnaD domain-containing protein n=1 Tax=Peptoclostridium sp. TaxID=1904860 RepID=UPI00139CEA32|nr:DnaD domain protein [Peptoclostridium sp.]MZQ75231.1 DnaD domain protein [Peptoclostridium sp.]
MARYRQVHTSFWQDGFVLELTPEEKYFYLYLMTNSKTNQCGIYELPKRIIETETGYNRETVDKLLQRFIGYGKIRYCEDTREIILLNWNKYNFINSKKVIACMEKELKGIKNSEFLRLFQDGLIEAGYPVDTVSIPYAYPMDRLGIDSGEEREEEREEEENKNKKEKKKEKEDLSSSAALYDKDFKKIVQAFDQNIHPITPMEGEKLSNWMNDMETDVIIAAIGEAVTYNKRSYGYINAILNNWHKSNITTMDGLNAYLRDRRDKQNGNDNSNTFENDQYADVKSIKFGS